MRKIVHILVVGMLTISILQAVLPSLNYDVEASPPPPSDAIDGVQYIEGDWYVNGTESYTNETIVLSGNLTVPASGTLILRNVTIAMNCTIAHGTYQIYVWGTLDISDWDGDPATTYDRSNITDSPFDVDDRSGNDYKYAIKTYSGASLSIENSIIREAGYSTSNNNYGVYIEYGDNANIQNCTIENGYYGIYFWRGDNIRVGYNEFRYCDEYALYMQSGSFAEVYNNIIHHNDFGAWLAKTYMTVCNNYIHNNSNIFNSENEQCGLRVQGGHNAKIYNNTLEYNGNAVWGYTLHIVNSDDVELYDNTLKHTKSGASYCALIQGSSNLLMYNNTIINNEATGLYLMYVSGNYRVINNNISNNTGYSAYVRSSSPPTSFLFKDNYMNDNVGMNFREVKSYNITNNIITNCSGTAIYVDDMAGGEFSNNIISGAGDHFYLADSFPSDPIELDTVLKVTNCSCDPSKTSFDPVDDAVLIIQNYLHLNVTDATSWVPGAYAEVRNITDAVVFTGYTDDNGRIKNIVVKNQTKTYYENISYDPVNITVTLSPYTAYGEIEPIMDKSQTVNVIFNNDLPPTPPSGLTAVSNGTNVDLDWLASPSTDVDHYLVYRNATGLGWDIVYNSSLFPGYELYTNWTDPKAASDWSTYHYYVVAVDAVGNPSEPTNIAFCGDWVVDSGLGYSGLLVQLNGSLIILPTGNLTFNNVKLQFNNSFVVTYGIEVLPNAKFWILDGDNDPQTTGDRSEIAGAVNSTMYFVMNGDEFVMRNSKLSYCGRREGIDYGSWTFNVEAPEVMQAGEPWMRGLYIGSPGAAVTIESNDFSDNFVTILIDNVNDCTIADNTFFTNTFGIYLNNSHFNLIDGNTFTNHQAFQVYMFNSGNHIITYNEFNNTAAIQAGLMLYGSDCLSNNIFYNNFTGNFRGVYIYNGGDDNNISSNYFYDIVHGIQIYYTSQNTVMNNLYSDISSIGIRFQGVGFSSIQQENMNLVGDGLYIYQSNNLFISGLNIENASSSGISIFDSINIQIREISFISCSFGLYISDGNTITIIDITIKDTTTGIYCSANPTNIKLFTSTISDNTVTAIEVDTCAEFILTNCTLDATLYNFNLIDAAVTLFNTTYNQTKVILNPSSSITLWWYIKIHVRDWFDDPVSGANVQIRKPLGTLVFNEFTDSNGDTRWFWLLERTQYAFSNETSTPYFIQAFNGTHSGSVEFWLNQSTVVWVILENTAPSVSNAIIAPSLPTTVDDLNLDYLYSDPENDPEGSTMILWYTDGIHNTTFNNQTEINQSFTIKGQTWFCEVIPHDGAIYGIPMVSTPVSIQNTPPVVENVSINQPSPTSSDFLNIAYNFSDIDDDSEGQSQYRWHFWDGLGWAYSGVDSLELDPSFTTKGEQWKCVVTPHDGDDLGNPVDSNNVTIGNSAPEVMDVIITPVSPKSNETLYVNYTYFDLDSDLETGSMIRWYKNGTEQAALENSTSVDASLTLKGETWNYIITPHDGEDFGVPILSEAVYIGNTPPTVSNITISPLSPTTEDDLNVSYDYSDNDGDSEHLDTIVRWLRWNGMEFFDTGLRGKTLPSEHTFKNEIWTCEVIPHDGWNEGAPTQSDMNVTIVNSAPFVINAKILPPNAISISDLLASYQYVDLDFDSQSGSLIRWYLNDVEQTDLNDSVTVSASRTLKGEVWYYIVTPSDGEDFGSPVQSENITIGNTPPSVSNITISPLTPDTEDVLTVSYDFFDIDGDSESLDTVIKWLRWSVSDFFDTGHRGRNLSAEITFKGEIWTCEVIPHDGEGEGLANRSDMNVTIINSAPTILGAEITPSNPTSVMDLTASYDYWDVDLDFESGSLIRWYQNDLEQWDLNDSITVSAFQTLKGDIWYYIVTPSDGEDPGAPFKSENVTIGNTPPEALNITITPLNPKTGDDLTVSYDFFDIDGDSESLDTVVKWLRWSGSDFFDTGLRGKNLSSLNTQKGEMWTCEVVPHDGEDEGPVKRSDMNVTIINTPPAVVSAQITPLAPTSEEDLNASYTYQDVDFDIESGTLIRWNLNDVEQVDLNDSINVSASRTQKGEIWYYIITPSDGEEYGTPFKSGNVTIGNTPPSVSNITISPLNPKTGDVLTVSYDFFDIDGDSESLDTTVRWLRWDGVDFFDTGIRGKNLSAVHTQKGEMWTCEVIPHDGLNEGTAIRSDMNVTINNTLPSVSGADISPSNPTSDSDLNASYIFLDVDSDSEFGSTIRWFKDGIEQVDHYGNFTINHTKTKPGEVWYYMITPSDGFGFGTEVQSTNVTIGNTPPFVTNITISPLNPDTLDDLTVTYDFYDSDGNNESLDTVVRWLRWDIDKFIDTGLRGKTLSSDYLSRGEIWTCEVVPHDGLNEGTATRSDMNVTINNTAPSVLSADISPTSPTSDSDLTASYIYDDMDSDPESGSTIRWFKDDVEQLDQYGNITINNSKTTPGEIWYYMITPSDGIGFGMEVKSGNVTIGNTPPYVTNITISPLNPDTLDDLTVTYDYYDSDGNNQSLDTVVRWLRWDINKFIDTGLRGKTLSSGYTAQGDIWTCEVVPHDGLDEGAATQSDMNVTIGNTEPSILSASITPSEPPSGSNLTADYDFFDVDDDPESGSMIRWYKNNVEQWGLNDTFSVTSSLTQPGEIWHYIITPSDGMKYGTAFVSENVTIGNTPPYASNITISPSNPDTGDDLTVTYDYYDVEGTNESLDTVVRWLRWDIDKFIDTGHRGKTLSSDYTARDEIWTCEVIPHDGLDEGAPTRSDMNVTIQNTVPTVLSAVITPSNPTADSDISASYNYNDVDSDTESGSTISWFQNGVEQLDLFGNFSVNQSRTAKGDIWYYIITPSDGLGFGTPYKSENKTIGNTPPYLANITISPIDPTTSDDLTASYDYYDNDGDTESLDTVVKWLRWSGSDFFDTGHRGKTLSSANTAKGEIWTCEVIPHDGGDEGTATRSDMNVTIGNSAPSILGAQIIPANPTAADDLDASYTYYDVDSDAESGSMIAWFRNGIEQTDLNGSLSVNSARTQKGDTWYYIITSSDGEGYGVPVQSDTSTIGNTPPQVSNIAISPLNPSTGDGLVASYDYFDSDGDTESFDTTVKWLLWSGFTFIDTGYRGKTLSSAHTSKSEIWTCEVILHDGEDEGSATLSSMNVTIANTAPAASDAVISPTEPTSEDDLTSDYDYTDVDLDSESGSIIQWFRNGIEQVDLLGSFSVNFSRTNKGEGWYYTIRPHDGEDYGTPVQSDSVIIGNIPPSVLNITITPLNPTTQDDLTVTYDFYDGDGDSESLDTTVRWLKWSGTAFVDTGFRGPTLSSSQTSKGELWTCEISPHDGVDSGATVASGIVVTILNSKPTILDAYITPLDPTTASDLYAEYDYYDIDGDLESGTEIVWFRDNDHMPELDNQTTVPHGLTQKGQIWNFSVRPNDNYEFGDWVKSSSITIQNNPPHAENLTISPNPPLGDDNLIASYTYQDIDGDTEYPPEIRWYKNGILQTLYDDELEIDLSATEKGELWFFSVKVYDGEDWSDSVDSHYVVIENSKPVMNEITPSAIQLVINETESIEFLVDAEDPDGDLLIYRWKLGKTTVADDEYFLFETDYGSAGVYTLNLTIQDFGERSYALYYEWEVTVNDVNRAPKIDITEPLSKSPQMKEDTSLKFLIDESDLDSEDTLDITWYFDNVVAQEGGSSYTYHADFSAAGAHEVRAIVDDGTDSVDYSWNLSVENVEESLGREEFLGFSYDWWGLILAIMSGVVALLLAFIGLMRVKKKKGALKKYMAEIDELTKDTDLSPEEYEERLSDIEARINDEFKQGLIEDLHYLMLQDLVASKRGEARKAEVASMFGRLPAGVVKDLDNMLKDGKITPEEYEGFVATISMTESLTPDEKDELSKVIEKWEVEDGDVTSEDSQTVKDKIIKDELDEILDDIDTSEDE